MRRDAIDACTIRLCKRFGIKGLKYKELKRTFERLPKDLEVYNEFHALIDKPRKTYRKAKPVCFSCHLTGEWKFKNDFQDMPLHLHGRFTHASSYQKPSRNHLHYFASPEVMCHKKSLRILKFI